MRGFPQTETGLEGWPCVHVGNDRSSSPKEARFAQKGLMPNANGDYSIFPVVQMAYFQLVEGKISLLLLDSPGLFDRVNAQEREEIKGMSPPPIDERGITQIC